MRVAVRVGEAEQVALQVRDAVRAVGVPDEHALAARGAQWNARGSDVAAGQVRRRARGPVVRDREVAHAAVGEHERQAGRPAGTSVCIAVTTSTRGGAGAHAAKRSCRASSSIESASACIVNGSAHTSNRPLRPGGRASRSRAAAGLAASQRSSGRLLSTVQRKPSCGGGEVERRVEVREVVAQHAPCGSV